MGRIDMETQKHLIKYNEATLVILEDGKIRIQKLDKQLEWRVGRFDTNMPTKPDIPLHSQIVDREHGVIRNIDGQWYYIDNPQNYNRTFYNGSMIPRPKNSMKRIAVCLESGDALRIDHKNSNMPCNCGVLLLFTKAKVDSHWVSYKLPKRSIVIGRNQNCDIVNAAHYISENHAKISYISGKYYLSDCNSTTGTFLNGHKVEDSTPLQEKDIIGICGSIYIFSNRNLIYEKKDYKKQRETLRMTSPQNRQIILSANI